MKCGAGYDKGILHWVESRPSLTETPCVQFPYEIELQTAGLLPSERRWEALCAKCGWRFRYDRQARRIVRIFTVLNAAVGSESMVERGVRLRGRLENLV